MSIKQTADNIQKAIDYFENHMDENVSVDQLACHAGFSRSHFSLLFTTMTGQPVNEYCRKRRLTRAAACLIASDEKVLSIALGHGYDSYEGFSRSFKKYYHCSPSQYRKMNEPWSLMPKIHLTGKRVVVQEGGKLMHVTNTMNQEQVRDHLQTSGVVLDVDFDNFMAVNTDLGRPFGDYVLAEGERRIKAVLNQGHVIRIGGDEFLVILHERSNEEGVRLAKLIGQAMEEPFTFENIQRKVTVSIGLTDYQAGEDAAVTLARSAMLKAKEKGRNKVMTE